jgi:hypothetical protein
MANATQTGVNREAGLYAFSALSYTNLYLNYTVVATANGSGYDLTRQINVQLEAGSNTSSKFRFKNHTCSSINYC